MMNAIKKSKTIWLGITAVIMFLLPFAMARLASECAGMALCMLSFFVINPLYSAILGFVSGRNIRDMWSMPSFAAILFLAGTWIFFDSGEVWFIAYAVVYMVIGYFTMWIGKRFLVS